VNHSRPANRRPLTLAAVILAEVAAAACATTGRPPSMGCLDPLAADCDDPSAYPPLTAMLPPWPFPRLLVPLPEGDRK
jgi:hypothetical protein